MSGRTTVRRDVKCGTRSGDKVYFPSNYFFLRIQVSIGIPASTVVFKGSDANLLSGELEVLLELLEPANLRAEFIFPQYKSRESVNAFLILEGNHDLASHCFRIDSRGGG